MNGYASRSKTKTCEQEDNKHIECIDSPRKSGPSELVYNHSLFPMRSYQVVASPSFYDSQTLFASCDPDTSSSDSYSATTCHPSLLFALAASLSNDFWLRAFSLPWISTPMHSRMAPNSRLARMGFNPFEPFVEQPYSFCRFFLIEPRYDLM